MYETARQETAQFVLAVVADIWARELRDTETIYIEVSPNDLFSHLQAGWMGQNTLDLLVLQNEMQRYPLKVWASLIIFIYSGMPSTLRG